MDPKFGFPVSLGAFGEWGLRIEDSRSFLTQLVATVFDSRTGSSQGEAALTEKIEDYFAAEISQRFSSAVAQMAVKQGISVFEINVYLNELAEFTAEQIRPEFERFGIEIVHFNVERVNIPEEEQKKFQEVLGRKMEIEQISQAKVGEAYATMRTFDTLEKAAESDGGAGGIIASGLGLGIGVGAGVPLGQKMGGAMNTDPAPQTEDDPVARLRQLKQMFDEGLITEEQFEAKKEEVLKQM